MVTSTQIGKNGRFGNQLFQIAAVIGYAKNRGVGYKLPKWWCELSGVSFEPYFENYKSEDIDENIFSNIYNEPNFSYNEIPFIENINLRGYYQSFRYFENSEDEVRKIFTPSVIKEKMGENVVSLHVRRGDYNLSSGAHVPLGSGYYRKAYDHYGHDKTYLVFSDAGIDEAFSVVPFIKNKVFMSTSKDTGQNYIGSDKNITVDFFNMVSCVKHVIANSSLSWWAAWLSGGEVVAPSKWFGDSYGNCIGYEQADLIPGTWKIL